MSYKGDTLGHESTCFSFIFLLFLLLNKRWSVFQYFAGGIVDLQNLNTVGVVVSDHIFLRIYVLLVTAEWKYIVLQSVSVF